MSNFSEIEERMELRGFVRPGDPLWSRCMDRTPRKALALVLGLANEALEIQARIKMFTDDNNHPLALQLRHMTPTEALTYLLVWTKDCSGSPGVQLEPRNQDLPIPTPALAQEPSQKATVRPRKNSERLPIVKFAADEFEALSCLPGPVLVSTAESVAVPCPSSVEAPPTEGRFARFMALLKK